MTLQQIAYYLTDGDPAIRPFGSHAEALAYAREYRASRT